MRPQFSLFQSHLDLAHHYWRRLLQEGGWVVDATCGAGRDTLFIASCLTDAADWGVISLDIQSEALTRTGALIDMHLSAEEKNHIHLIQHSHTTFPPIAHQHPIRLIVYNLGYLPGGDKNKTTQTSTTLTSVTAALNLLTPGGVISLMCYPGHPEGAKEERALIEKLSLLPPSDWSVFHHRALNRAASPSLILVQKKLD
jgi:hypothetical protein